MCNKEDHTTTWFVLGNELQRKMTSRDEWAIGHVTYKFPMTVECSQMDGWMDGSVSPYQGQGRVWWFDWSGITAGFVDKRWRNVVMAVYGLKRSWSGHVVQRVLILIIILINQYYIFVDVVRWGMNDRQWRLQTAQSVRLWAGYATRGAKFAWWGKCSSVVTGR